MPEGTGKGIVPWREPGDVGPAAARPGEDAFPYLSPRLTQLGSQRLQKPMPSATASESLPCRQLGTACSLGARAAVACLPSRLEVVEKQPCGPGPGGELLPARRTGSPGFRPRPAAASTEPRDPVTPKPLSRGTAGLRGHPGLNPTATGPAACWTCDCPSWGGERISLG